ncbi:MAG: hypothetical protein IKN80_04640 [Clostridiales bacterium]|nr:hypothetical protein [Clostridiales bacterium]
MYYEILRQRLDNLYDDLTLKTDEAVSLVNFMVESIGEKNSLIKDIYFRDRAPVKVINTAAVHVKGRGDAEDEVIALSEGYDRFISQIGIRTVSVLDRHTRALTIFLNILSLPDPYARILYLKFVRLSTMDEIAQMMFMSKSSCYRKQEQGIKLLYQMMEDPEEE